MLARAVERQEGMVSRQLARREGMSLAELKTIATEVGGDPSHVESSACELMLRRERGLPAPLESAAHELVHVHVLDASVDDGAWEQFVRDLRETFGMHGVVTAFGAAREWQPVTRDRTAGLRCAFASSRTAHGMRSRCAVTSGTPLVHPRRPPEPSGSSLSGVARSRRSRPCRRPRSACPRCSARSQAPARMVDAILSAGCTRAPTRVPARSSTASNSTCCAGYRRRRKHP